MTKKLNKKDKIILNTKRTEVYILLVVAHLRLCGESGACSALFDDLI